MELKRGKKGGEKERKRRGNWGADRGRGLRMGKIVRREKSKQLVEIIKRLVTVIELKLS